MTEIVERSPSPKSSSRFRELGHKPCTTGTPCPEGGDYSRGTVIGDKSIEPTSEEIAEVRLPSEDLPQQFDAMKHSSTPLADFEDLDHAKDMPPEALFHAKQLRDELVTTNSHPEDAKNPQPVYSQASHSENGCSNQPVVPHQSSPRIKEGFTSLKLEKPSTSTLFENITTHDDLFGGSNVVEDSFFDHLETPVGETNYIQPSEQQGYNTGGQQYASQEQQYAYFQQDQPSAQYNDVQSHDHQNTQQQYRFDASYSQPTDYNPQPIMNPQYGTYQNPPQSYAFGSQESFYNHATANQSSPLDQSTIYSQTPDSQPVQPVYSQQDSGYRPVPPIIMYNQQSHTQHDEPIMSPTTAKRLLNGYGDPPNIPYSMDHKSTYGHNQNQQYYNQLPQYSAAYQYQRSDQHQSQLAPPKTPSLPPSTFGPPAQPQSPHLARPQDAISRIQQIQSAPSTSDLYSSRPTTQDSGILHPRQTSNTSSNGSYHGHEFNSGFYTPMSSTFPASPFYGPSSYLSPKRESKNVSASTSFVAAKGGYSSPYDLPPQIAKQKPRSLTTPSSALAFNNPVVPSLLPPPKSLKAFSDAGSERGGSTNTFPGSEMPVPNREPQIYAPMEENYLHQPLQPLQQEKQSLESPFMPSGETFSPVVAQTADAFPLVINESNEEMFKSPFPSSQSMKKEMPKSDYYNPRRHRPPSISEPQIRHGYQGDPPLPLSGQTVDDSQKDPSEGSDYKPYGQYGNCPPTTAMNTALQAIQQSREKKQSFGSPPRTLLSSVQKRAMMRPLSPIYTPPPQASQINPYLNSYALPDVGSQEPLTNARLASPQGITDILDDSPGKSSSEGPQAVREEARGDTIDDYSIPNAAMDSYAPITINPNPLDEGDFAGHDSQLIAEELADGSENNGRYTETNAYKPLIPERVTSPTYSDHSIPSGPPKRFASPYCPDSYTVSPVMSPSIVPITVLSKPTSPPHAASLPPHISQKRPHAGTNPSNPKSASSLAQMQRSVSPYAPSGPSTIPSFPTSTYNQSTYETQQKNDPSEYHNFGTGHPLITFGFGGKIITMFPHQIQRYAADGSTISKGAPGLMNIANLRDYIKAEDHTTFPGPVYQVGASKGAMKAKRKECSAWLQNTINKLDNETFYGTEVERQHFEHIVILFKLLKVYTDHETPLDGSTEIEVACKEILMPGLSTLSLAKNEDASFTVAAHLSQGQHSRQISDGSPLSQYPVTKEFIASIGQSLLRGDREGAIRSALDNRMWAHAMLIASCVSKDRWKSVVKEFVRTELENAGEGSESLKVLYEVFAGHGSDAVEELLPPSSLFVHSNTQVDISGHLDRWRETLTMILANKTAGDTEAIAALGTQLEFNFLIYISYILSRDVSTFEAIDAPKKNMVLVGASHEKYPFDFYRDHDAIKLSEIYELVKCNGPTGMQGIPHLQAYKLYYAWILSDFGMTSTAQRQFRVLQISDFKILRSYR
ncbi:COPII coat assembly protein sec16 [Neolecta irregularis DAH-3]|uniref:Protein transport protein sec16 n=1 Tax=Neolecta irregularis (strain DAH-3) TaxID=1198029 RepID=A0A1U7LQS5_NEOID|nr:COPII coat assembly protein sec16 [Neolecta irregularis DAH-3]|eukprot:OLL24933.1 COPII coat assembly protein sec16 [Neolecta irregularis DAH-3]